MAAASALPVNPPIIIEVPVMRDADDALWLQFSVLLVQGIEKWLTKLGGDPSGLALAIQERLRQEVIATLSSEQIVQAFDCTDAQEKQLRTRAICDAITALIQSSLNPIQVKSKVGAPRIFTDRDSEIHELLKTGKSLARVGKEVRILRHAVQAAEVREKARRQAYYQQFLELQRVLEPLGIVLKERE